MTRLMNRVKFYSGQPFVSWSKMGPGMLLFPFPSQVALAFWLISTFDSLVLESFHLQSSIVPMFTQ